VSGEVERILAVDPLRGFSPLIPLHISSVICFLSTDRWAGVRLLQLAVEFMQPLAVTRSLNPAFDEVRRMSWWVSPVFMQVLASSNEGGVYRPAAHTYYPVID